MVFNFFSSFDEFELYNMLQLFVSVQANTYNYKKLMTIEDEANLVI